jgi:hypothetical protein
MDGVKAIEGQWYTDRATNDSFCVIAVDDSDGFIDVRDSYGDIDELDLAEWEAMDLVPCGAPAGLHRGGEADEHSQRR